MGNLIAAAAASVEVVPEAWQQAWNVGLVIGSVLVALCAVGVGLVIGGRKLRELLRQDTERAVVSPMEDLKPQLQDLRRTQDLQLELLHGLRRSTEDTNATVGRVDARLSGEQQQLRADLRSQRAEVREVVEALRREVGDGFRDVRAEQTTIAERVSKLETIRASRSSGTLAGGTRSEDQADTAAAAASTAARRDTPPAGVPAAPSLPVPENTRK